MPYPSEHAARIRDPKLFDPDTFRRTKGGKATFQGSGMITVPKSISIIWGKLKTANKPTDYPLPQALRFPTKDWTADKAKKWLADQKIKYMTFEPAAAPKGEYNFTMDGDPNNPNDPNYDPNPEPESDPEDENKPLLLYMPIYDQVAQDFVEKMNCIPEDQDINIWLNSPGGRVFAGWSIIGALQKRTGQKNISVFGHAMSMAVYLPLFCDYSECLEVTQFMLHRADGYIENSDDQLLLDNVNKDLRKQMESRLNMDKFESICGITIDDLFNANPRRDIMLTAKQAKSLGLISKIIKLSPEQIKAQSNEFVAFAEFGEQRSEPTRRSDREEPIINSQNNKKMTLAELQAQHPELYAQIVKDAISSERERVKAYMAFLDADKENCVKAIKEGTPFSTDVMAELQVKLTAFITKGNILADGEQNPKPGTGTPPAPKSETEKKVEDEEKQVNEALKQVTF